jgi:hypothetical protein
MQLLISRSDLAQYKQMAKTTFNDKLNEQIRDAQLLDLQPLIGESLFNSILAAPQDHTELLEGGVYEHDGISYQNYGLKMVLSYFAYARYAMFSSVIDTSFSMVEKLNDNSRPAEPLAKKTLYTLNRDAAMQLWGNVKNYLTRTRYTGYKLQGQNAPKGGFRLKKIG